MMDNDTTEFNNQEAPDASFSALGLSAGIIQTLDELGYETPTPIQQQTIPILLAGSDLIGQAQTGTGKTAAFALPILDKLDLNQNAVQALILTPTRELAIQVSEAVHVYAKRLGRVRVLPIYGGDPIAKQITRLRGGLHIVVGTPGRIMDHLRRGTLDFSALKFIVLDEADEMLRMGFIEDIEWILGQAPPSRQTALFSATMPREVRRIADRYLQNAVTVEIKHKTMTVPTIDQHFIAVPERQKLSVLTRLLETEAIEGGAILIFARTKIGAADLAEKLQARGYEAEAMHGDMTQAQRESVIRRMRGGQLEIVVATDVAARGLDVEHIGCVINYDIPNDPESFVHRIGRTGRAGRAGRAILFVAPRETRLLRLIENYSGQRMKPMKMPTSSDVAERRMTLFKERILKTLQEQEEELGIYRTLVEELAEESGRDMSEIAASAARLASGDKPLSAPEAEREEAPSAPIFVGENGRVRLFINAGRDGEIRPADIVGAIANEAGIPGNAIGAIDIFDEFLFVDVPSNLAEQVLDGMRGAKLRGNVITTRPATEEELASHRASSYGGKKAHRKGDKGFKRRVSSAPVHKKRDPRKGKKSSHGANSS